MNWVRRNAWRLAAVAVLIPVYLGVEMWDGLAKRDRVGEQLTMAGSEITDRGISWRLEGIRDPAVAKTRSGKTVRLPKDTRLVVVRLGHKGKSLVCSVRVRDGRGWMWIGSTPGTEDVWLDAPRFCPLESSDKAPSPGQWGPLAVPFLVPVDARDLRVEVQLATAPGEPKRWARLVP